jgi:chemotaxis signal transduction protein
MLLFQVGARPYAIDLSCVKSIQSLKHNVDEGAEGSITPRRLLDDEQTSLYDLISIFEKDTVGRDFENEKMIMVEAAGLSMGLIVSRVDNVISIDTDRIKPLSPIFKQVAMSCFPKVFRHEENLVLLLAPEGIEKVLQNETNSDFRRPVENEKIVDMISEIIDTADIDDESQYESASFLTNLLQADR